ncbi:MAG: RluA family pseudouridine synthase [Schwartzia sp.]|nr:RluA family pseudouridine synthase [Schwartzia sp. (in: firmicutes)]
MTEFSAERDGERLDVFLARMAIQGDPLSRSRIQKLITDGNVTVDGKPAKASLRLAAGAVVAVELPEPEATDIAPENIPLDILYEDEDVIVVNKARGMVVHPAAGVSSGTLVNALLAHCKDLSGINGALRPGIVHRLDKDTSGVMIAAKNDTAHRSLAEQIQEKTAKRVYWAILTGNIREEEGVIHGAIGRNPKDRQKMTVVRENGKDATTNFRVLERFGAYTLAECRLMTGRTHQIRVHMAYIGHPVLGDPKYGAKKCPFSIEGQALHSKTLMFTHPRTGEKMEFEAPLPEDMQIILDELRGKK